MLLFVVRTALAAAIAAITVTAWGQELPPAHQGPVDFTADVAPVLSARCVSCHDANKQKSDLRLDTRELMLKGGIEGPAIVVGDSANSLLIQLMAGTHPDFDRMPPKEEPVSNEQIGKIRTWIDQGAAWPDGVVLAAAAAPAAAGDVPTEAKAEGLPEDWKVEATNQQGALAKWARLTDLKGPDGAVAFGVTEISAPNPDTFNLLWTPKHALKNGLVEIKVKSVSGQEQGGGVMWRIKDKNNYYLARYTPAEKKFGVFKAIDGKLEQIGTADIESAQEWNTITVDQTDDHIVASLNGQTLIDIKDASLTEAGGVGYWTKGDAVAAFSGSRLEPR